MPAEPLAVLIVEAGRAKVCRFNVELRGETLWRTDQEGLLRRLAASRPEIVAVAGDFETAGHLADELRRSRLAQAVLVITPAVEQEPTQPGQVRVDLPEGAASIRPEELLRHLVQAMLSAQANAPVSPVTGLPGSLVLRQEVERRLGAGESFVFLYLDLDNFKAYNDVYGFGRGDIAIRMLSRQIVNARKALGEASDLCTHIGGDDFAILTTDRCYDQIARRIISEFDRHAPELYSSEDQARGYIECPSRRGEPSRYPLMTISIGGVNSSVRQIASYLHLTEIAAEVKSYAKALPGSQFVMDRRRE
jgi:GGDEF domain-containing protein